MKKTTTQTQQIFFPPKTVLVAYGLLHSQPQTHLFYDFIGIYHTDNGHTTNDHVLRTCFQARRLWYMMYRE